MSGERPPRWWQIREWLKVMRFYRDSFDFPPLTPAWMKWGPYRPWWGWW